MAGYSGYSMSNNAVAAYENGEKPLHLMMSGMRRLCREPGTIQTRSLVMP